MCIKQTKRYLYDHLLEFGSSIFGSQSVIIIADVGYQIENSELFLRQIWYNSTSTGFLTTQSTCEMEMLFRKMKQLYILLD